MSVNDSDNIVSWTSRSFEFINVCLDSFVSLLKFYHPVFVYRPRRLTKHPFAQTNHEPYTS